MGLNLFVGYLIEEEDAERFASIQDQFARVNQALKAAGLPPHIEPLDARDGAPWDCQMYGYSGLHYLRRVAAHIAAGHGLPPPGDDRAADDPVLRGFYAQFYNADRPKRFQHLIQHSDADGFYLPLAFHDVIFPDPALHVDGEAIGSVPMLLEECTQLAEVLALPLDLDPESEAVQDAADWQGKGETTWQRYGVESFTCLALYRACQISLESGCAIVFG